MASVCMQSTRSCMGAIIPILGHISKPMESIAYVANHVLLPKRPFWGVHVKSCKKKGVPNIEISNPAGGSKYTQGTGLGPKLVNFLCRHFEYCMREICPKWPQRHSLFSLGRPLIIMARLGPPNSPKLRSCAADRPEKNRGHFLHAHCTQQHNLQAWSCRQGI